MMEKKISQDIFLSRIRSLQKLINPIPIKSLSKKFKMSNDEIIEKLLTLIENGMLIGRIKDEFLYLPEHTEKFENILTLTKKIEIIGNYINLKVRLRNNTRFFLQDLMVLFSFLIYDVSET